MATLATLEISVAHKHIPCLFYGNREEMGLQKMLDKWTVHYNIGFCVSNEACPAELIGYQLNLQSAFKPYLWSSLTVAMEGKYKMLYQKTDHLLLK